MNSNLIRQNFSITIKASVETVWHKMLDKESYKYWVQEFEPGSYYEGDFQLGNEVKFLSSDGFGMRSKVVKFEKYKLIGFEHFGSFAAEEEAKNNDSQNETSEHGSGEGNYNGAVEEYYFEEKNGETEVRVIADSAPGFADYMAKSWDRALLRLKENAESPSELKYITPLLVKTTINASPEKVWEYFTTPQHIQEWSNASDDWGCKDSKVDLRAGGRFSSYLYALDESFGFEFSGTYTEVTPFSLIKYTLDDNRKVFVIFSSHDGDKTTQVRQFFEPESQNPLDQQQQGWQAFLDNLKKYIESSI